MPKAGKKTESLTVRVDRQGHAVKESLSRLIFEEISTEIEELLGKYEDNIRINAKNAKFHF